MGRDFFVCKRYFEYAWEEVLRCECFRGAIGKVQIALSRIRNFLRTCDIFWQSLNGLTVDVAHITSNAKARTPLSITGTLKVEQSLIPCVDFRLNRVLKKYGGWNCVMNSAFEPTEKFYTELLAAGYDRQRFERSRAYVINPAFYTRDALASANKSDSD